jgi:hypothetical protein
MPPWHHGTMTRCGTLYSHPHCQISAIIDTFFYLRFEELDRSRLSFPLGDRLARGRGSIDRRNRDKICVCSSDERTPPGPTYLEYICYTYT